MARPVPPEPEPEEKIEPYDQLVGHVETTYSGEMFEDL
jgi:hypothetical protein